MSQPQPIALTETLLERIKNHGTVTKVVSSALELYSEEPDRIGDALLTALESAEDLSAPRRTTVRTDEHVIQEVKRLARRIDMPFEALVRIIMRHYLASEL